MQLLYILQKIRNDGRPFKEPKEKYKELNQAMDLLQQKIPFVGRIIIHQKSYGGRIEKLKFNDGHLQFTITDCDRNGQSRKSAKTHRKKVSYKDLMDIMTM